VINHILDEPGGFEGQTDVYAIRMHVPKAKYDYTGRFATAGREQFREIKIMSQQDAAFIQSLFQDERIKCPLKTLILKMGGGISQRIAVLSKPP
jgi:hypothetical protein